MYNLDLSEFLQTQSLEEIIEVLDEMLYVLAMYVELMDSVPDRFGHHYLTIRELRNLFIQLKQEEDGK